MEKQISQTTPEPWDWVSVRGVVYKYTKYTVFHIAVKYTSIQYTALYRVYFAHSKYTANIQQYTAVYSIQQVYRIQHVYSSIPGILAGSVKQVLGYTWYTATPLVSVSHTLAHEPQEYLPACVWAKDRLPVSI